MGQRNDKTTKTIEDVETPISLDALREKCIVTAEQHVFLASVERSFMEIVAKGFTLRNQFYKTQHEKITENIFMVCDERLNLFQLELIIDLDKVGLFALFDLSEEMPTFARALSQPASSTKRTIDRQKTSTEVYGPTLEIKTNEQPTPKKSNLHGLFTASDDSEVCYALIYLPDELIEKFLQLEQKFLDSFPEKTVNPLIDELSQLAVITIKPTVGNDKALMYKNLNYASDRLGETRLRKGHFYLFYKNYKVRQLQLRLRDANSDLYLFEAMFERKFNPSSKVICRIREILFDLSEFGMVVLPSDIDKFFDLGLSSFRFLICMLPIQAFSFITPNFIEEEKRRTKLQNLLTIQQSSPTAKANKSLSPLI